MQSPHTNVPTVRTLHGGHNLLPIFPRAAAPFSVAPQVAGKAQAQFRSESQKADAA